MLTSYSNTKPMTAMHVAASLGDLATLIWYEQSGHCAYDQVDDWMDVAAQWLFGAFGLDAEDAPTPAPSTQVEPPGATAQVVPTNLKPQTERPAEDVVISVDPAAIRRASPAIVSAPISVIAAAQCASFGCPSVSPMM